MKPHTQIAKYRFKVQVGGSNKWAIAHDFICTYCSAGEPNKCRVAHYYVAHDFITYFSAGRSDKYRVAHTHTST